MTNDIDKEIEEKTSSVFAKLGQGKRKGLSGRTPIIRNKKANIIPENQEAVPIDDSDKTPQEKDESNEFKNAIDSHIESENKETKSKGSKPQNNSAKKNTKQTKKTSKRTSQKTLNKNLSKVERNESISTNISFDHLLMLLKLKRKIRKAKRKKITHNDVIEEALELVGMDVNKHFKNYKKSTNERTESLKVNVTEYHYDLIEDICFKVRKKFRMNLGFNDICEIALEKIEKEY